MNAGDRLARRPGRPVDPACDTTADRVVEHQHALGAGGFRHEPFALGIVHSAQLVLVIEVLDRTAVLDQGQTFAVERQMRRHRASIVDRHPMRLGDTRRTGHAGRRVISQVYRLFGHQREVI